MLLLFLTANKNGSACGENKLKSPPERDIVSPSNQKEIKATKGKAIDYRIDEV